MTEQPDPDRARWRADRQRSRAHARAGERRVQADLSGGVQHPQRARPDQPQAPTPNDLKQPLLSRQQRLAVLLGTGGEHEQRSRSARGRLGGELEHLIARGRDDHELRSDLQLGEAARGPHRAHHTPRTVDRRDNTLKAAGDDVLQHRTADIARRRRGADNGHRRGREDRPQRCDRGEMVALVDPLQHRLRRRDIQRHRQLTRPRAPHGEAGVLEHPQHQPIAGRHFRIEAVDPAVRRDLSELLEHPHPDPAALIIISHRKRDLGDTRLAQPVIAGDSHHATVVPAEQRQAINSTSLRVRARDSVGPPKPVEAQVTALRRETVIERLDVLVVHRRRGLQPQRRPIAQQHVADQPPGLGRRSERHISPLPSSAHTRPVIREQPSANRKCTTRATSSGHPSRPSCLARLRPIAAPTPRVLPVTWTIRPFSFARAGGCVVSRVSKVVISARSQGRLRSCSSCAAMSLQISLTRIEAGDRHDGEKH